MKSMNGWVDRRMMKLCVWGTGIKIRDDEQYQKSCMKKKNIAQELSSQSFFLQFVNNNLVYAVVSGFWAVTCV